MNRFALLLSLLFTTSAFGQADRVADQIYLLSAISIKTPWAAYMSDALIVNETGDPVTVTATYTPANTTPAMGTKHAFALGPYEQCLIPDLVGFIGASGFGPIVFNGCLSGADCAHATANYRNISVHTRISLPKTTGGTVGQNFDGIAWHAYGDAQHPQKLVGIELLAGARRTNIGVVNASDTNAVRVIATLYDGASHAKRDEATITLGPSASLGPQPVEEMFLLLGNWSRLNRSTPVTNAYVIFTSSGSDDAWFAYGSMVDAVTNDATTLVAFSPTALDDHQIASVYGTPLPVATTIATAMVAASSLRVSAKASVMVAAPLLTPENCMERMLGKRSPYGGYAHGTAMPDVVAQVLETCRVLIGGHKQ